MKFIPRSIKCCKRKQPKILTKAKAIQVIKTKRDKKQTRGDQASGFINNYEVPKWAEMK